MSDIPEGIVHKIEEKVEQMPLLSTQEHLFHIAIFGYHLRDKEVEELKEQINSLKVIADDE